MVVELFEHDMSTDVDWVALEEWIQGSAIPAMSRAGYSHVRWCWAEGSDGARLLIAWGEHGSPESLGAVWQRQEMRDVRDQFYALCPGTQVRRTVLTAVGG